MNKRTLRNLISYSAKCAILVFALSVSLFAQGKNPVILIPGLAGSELRDKDTQEKVWFKTLKPRSEDLRLPITADPARSLDGLVATDALRTIKVAGLPVFDVYEGFINAMKVRGGYHEESWETPSADGYHDSLYIFAYDWRADNVGNARILVRKVEALKVKLKRPDLKFDIVAHSMGGIISRYAAMYGDTDLPNDSRKLQPTWAGAKDFDKLILLGTPNEGSANALSAMVKGYSVGNVRIDLPFVQDSSKFMIFTIPSAYQLLPAPGTLKAFDEKLEPVNLDIYDPKVWSKYGWNVIDDKQFADRFSSAEQKAAQEYFAAVLHRAKRLHEALSAAKGMGEVDFYVVGADCKTALDGIVIYRDENAKQWKTLFRPKGFTRGDGSRVTDAELKKVMIAPGDGIVTKRSMVSATQSENVKVASILGNEPNKFLCENHNSLAANTRIQDHIIAILDKKAPLAKSGLGN